MGDNYKRPIVFIYLVLTVLILPFEIVSAQTGSIRGEVKDAQTNLPLPNANIFIQQITVGTSSNVKGFYQLLNIPVGNHSVIFSYLGYQADTVSVSVKTNSTVEINVSLSPADILGKEVVITGQLQGQTAAINKQLSSDNIVNVVSQERIRDLPDNNAAESVGRLPGIAIKRSAGEAQRVLIRGLDPSYANITLNGQIIPATSSNRSTDLSIISSNELQGIEVFKTLTPDMPGDAIAGTVNFTIRKAQEGLHSQIDLRSGYNRLKNAVGQYKFSGNVSNRFYDNKLGVILSGTVESQPYTTHAYDLGYTNAGFDENGNLLLESSTLVLNYQTETRRRYGGTLNLDFEFSSGNTIQFYSLFSRKDRKPVDYTMRYTLTTYKFYIKTETWKSWESIWSNSINGRNNLFNIFEIDWTLSGSRTVNQKPEDIGIRFLQQGGYPKDIILDQGPEYMVLGHTVDFTKMTTTGVSNSSSSSKENNWGGKLNVEYPFVLFTNVACNIKTGFYFRGMERNSTNVDYSGSADPINAVLLREYPDIQTYNGGPIVTPFLDNSIKVDDFMDGRFNFPYFLQSDLGKHLFDTYRDEAFTTLITSVLDDYSAIERVYAGYLMSRLNFWKVTVIGGARYENTSNYYVGRYTDNLTEYSGTYRNVDTSVTYGNWLPNIQVKYQVTDEVALRLAYTKALKRPNYNDLVPKTIINRTSRSISSGNPGLKITKADNYEIGLSHHSSITGFISINGFYKKLVDVSYDQEINITDSEDQYYGYSLSMPVNAGHPTEVYGFELDLQTNFCFLSSPFDGIVLSANYTIIWKHLFPNR
ncbi:MAG: TonB-dependent receptor [Ignavibacteria bacterium]|jgi:TonB-dependent receptor